MVFFKPIPPTSLVVIDESGQYQLREQGVVQSILKVSSHQCFHNVHYMYNCTIKLLSAVSFNKCVDITDITI